MTIEVLGKSTGCPACDTLKKELAAEDIDYTFLDVMKGGVPRTAELKSDMMKRGIRSIPAVWKDGEFVGTGPDVITSLIEL